MPCNDDTILRRMQLHNNMARFIYTPKEFAYINVFFQSLGMVIKTYWSEDYESITLCCCCFQFCRPIAYFRDCRKQFNIGASCRLVLSSVQLADYYFVFKYILPNGIHTMITNVCMHYKLKHYLKFDVFTWWLTADKYGNSEPKRRHWIDGHF